MDSYSWKNMDFYGMTSVSNSCFKLSSSQCRLLSLSIRFVNLLLSVPAPQAKPCKNTLHQQQGQQQLRQIKCRVKYGGYYQNRTAEIHRLKYAQRQCIFSCNDMLSTMEATFFVTNYSSLLLLPYNRNAAENISMMIIESQ